MTEDTITISRAEYDALRSAAEDFADLQTYARIKARLASGDEELIPAAFANRILDGESALRVYRDLRGLTQVQLASVSGVNRVQITNIESGKNRGSAMTLAKLARALNVQVDDLI
jgi:mRNA interferase RelE/StbE